MGGRCDFANIEHMIWMSDRVTERANKPGAAKSKSNGSGIRKKRRSIQESYEVPS